jgi:hypothetical protein
VQLSDHFPKRAAPETGRRVIQLTQGAATCYPLYYFIPSLTLNERYLIYHRAEQGTVQLHRLALATGESVQITHGAQPQTGWQPWCVESGAGVLDHRSVLNQRRNEVIYFDGNVVHAVQVETLADRVLFTIPEDRLPSGQNCVTADGAELIYIHHERALYEEMLKQGYWGYRHLSKGTALAAFNLDTGAQRTLIRINSPIHHVLPFGERHLVFCHPCTENGMLLTDYQGGWYTHLRTQDDGGGWVTHYVATARGIAYEVQVQHTKISGGMYDPFSHHKIEFRLPDAFGYTHTGADPEGRLWFYENQDLGTGIHDLWSLARHDPLKGDEWLKLSGDWRTYGWGQKAHFHPRLLPDRRWILLTAGDPETETNHLFLLDAADLKDTEGVDW